MRIAGDCSAKCCEAVTIAIYDFDGIILMDLTHDVEGLRAPSSVGSFSTQPASTYLNRPSTKSLENSESAVTLPLIMILPVCWLKHTSQHSPRVFGSGGLRAEARLKSSSHYLTTESSPAATSIAPGAVCMCSGSWLCFQQKHYGCSRGMYDTQTATRPELRMDETICMA